MLSADHFIPATNSYFDDTTIPAWNYGAFCKACYHIPDFPTDPQLRKRLVPAIWAAQLARQANTCARKKALAAPHLAKLKFTTTNVNINANTINGFVNCQIDTLHHTTQPEASSSKRKAASTEEGREKQDAPRKFPKRQTPNPHNDNPAPPPYSTPTTIDVGIKPLEKAEDNAMNIRQHLITLQHDFLSKLADIDDLLQHHHSIIAMLQARRSDLQESFQVQLTRVIDQPLLRDHDDQLTDRDPTPMPTPRHKRISLSSSPPPPELSIAYDTLRDSSPALIYDQTGGVTVDDSRDPTPTVPSSPKTISPDPPQASTPMPAAAPLPKPEGGSVPEDSPPTPTVPDSGDSPTTPVSKREQSPAPPPTPTAEQHTEES